MPDGDNRYNRAEDREKFRQGYREIFGENREKQSGKWVLTANGLVPADQMREKPRQLIRVRDKSMEVPVERVKKDMKHESYVAGGYRSI